MFSCPVVFTARRKNKKRTYNRIFSNWAARAVVYVSKNANRRFRTKVVPSSETRQFSLRATNPMCYLQVGGGGAFVNIIFASYTRLVTLRCRRIILSRVSLLIYKRAAVDGYGNVFISELFT